MLSIIVYTGACVVAALLLSACWMLLSSMRSRHEMSSGRVILVAFILSAAAPYIYAEVLTRRVGPDIKDAVESCYGEIPLTGSIQYFRVVAYDGKHARALVVGSEQEDWGGTDRPVASVRLEKRPDGWHAIDYTVLHSERLLKDAIILPPYQ